MHSPTKQKHHSTHCILPSHTVNETTGLLVGSKHEVHVESIAPYGYHSSAYCSPVVGRKASSASVRSHRASEADRDQHEQHGRHRYHSFQSMQAPSPKSPRHEEHEESRRSVVFAIRGSLAVNVVLFVLKTWVAVQSSSMAVTAAALDSFLDLFTQLIIFFADREKRSSDVLRYPAGRSRLEPVGIVLCASLMGVASLEIAFRSCGDLLQGHSGEPPELSLDNNNLALLIFTILSKIALYLYCVAVQKHSSSVMVLAIDHRNDILSNIVAVATAFTSSRWPRYWWADPIGAILMSAYIVSNWLAVAKEQVEMLVGKAADPEFVEQITAIANAHHDCLCLDVVRAYHFGHKYLVELEVVMPAAMQVQEAHDISLELQQNIERLRQVERAFVHVDFMRRDEDEHIVALKSPRLTDRQIIDMRRARKAIANAVRSDASSSDASSDPDAERDALATPSHAYAAASPSSQHLHHFRLPSASLSPSGQHQHRDHLRLPSSSPSNSVSPSALSGSYQLQPGNPSPSSA